MLSEMFHAAFFTSLPSPLKIRLSERRRSLLILPSVRILSKVERQFDFLIEEVGMGYDDFLIEWVVIGL
mgnify:FL=1